MKVIIDSGKETVEDGLNEIVSCDKVLDEILSRFTEVNKSVNDIESSSSEQAAGVREISDAILQLDTVTQKNAGVVDESTKKSELLKMQSKKMTSIINGLQMIIFGNERNVIKKMKKMDKSKNITEEKFKDEIKKSA